MSVFPESSFAVVASCCCCACRSLWCQLLHWCSGVVRLHQCLYSVIALHWWGQLFGALLAGVCSSICTGGASCLVHYMQVSAASFAQVGPVVWCTTCRCLQHHLHKWGQLFGALHAGVCGIICTGGASCLVHYMQVSAASFAQVGPVVWCTTCRCLRHHLPWWGQLFGALHAGVCGIICTGGASCLVHYMQVSAASFALGACCTSVSQVVPLPLVVTVVSTVSTDVVMWAHFSCVCGFVSPSVPASRFCPDTIFQTAQPFATKFCNWMKHWGCHQQGQIMFWIFREYLSNKFSYLLNLLA